MYYNTLVKMSEQVVEQKRDEVFIDDLKDRLLRELSILELEEFSKEITAEILMRKCTEERRKKYINNIETIKLKYLSDTKVELEKLKRDLETNKLKLRAKFLKEEDEEEVDSDVNEEESEEEVHVVKPKRGRKKKT